MSGIENEFKKFKKIELLPTVFCVVSCSVYAYVFCCSVGRTAFVTTGCTTVHKKYWPPTEQQFLFGPFHAMYCGPEVSRTEKLHVAAVAVAVHVPVFMSFLYYCRVYICCRR